MSDSVRPHRQQPTGLSHPWDSPGKNTGVGCHFLLQCMKVESENEVAQLCLTLSDPMDCSLPGSSVHGIFLAAAVREEKEIKGIQIVKEEVKLSLFADDMILYIENPKDSTRKLLELIKNIVKSQDKKITYISIYSYILTIKNQKEELRKQSHPPLQQKE